ncbi:hypothetical protein ON010_g17243 [Phytophthora cinnamomi]|nr:hypothetical protein ON010_g17243 [Phytophthora cinnamomi]
MVFRNHAPPQCVRADEMHKQLSDDRRQRMQKSTLALKTRPRRFGSFSLILKSSKDNSMTSIDEWKMSGNKAVSSETITTSFCRCFLGAGNQLSLTTHSTYGEAFVALMAEHRAAGSTNDDVVVEAENSSESEDGDSFIDIIGKADF